MRIDLEVRKIGWKGIVEEIEFRAVSSYGQDFLEDELSLKGTGAPTEKLQVSNKLTAAGIIQRAYLDGLHVMIIGWGSPLKH